MSEDEAEASDHAGDAVVAPEDGQAAASPSPTPPGGLLVDPPMQGGPVPENRPGLVTLAFITIFQEGKGYISSMKKKADLQAWVRHVLMWHDGRALSCKRSGY